jgi:hypothetical protein
MSDLQPEEVVLDPVTELAATPVAPITRRNPNDVYAFAAFICAILPIPIFPAAAALMLVRSTEVAEVPLSPSAQGVANTARTIAYVSIALVVAFCAALLLGVLGRTISS